MVSSQSLPIEVGTLPIEKAMPRLLFVLHSSIFERYGGVEYYLDDMITMACEVYGSENVRVVAPLTGEPQAQRPYSVRFAPRPRFRWLRKLANRFPLSVITAAEEEIDEFEPSVIINSHVAFGPTVWWLARRNRLPFVTVVYGIDCWGKQFFINEWALRAAKGIISISHWTKKILVERGYQPQGISLLSPRLPEHLEKRPVATKAATAEKRCTLLTVSRLDANEQYKGHEHVLQALSALKKSEKLPPLRYVVLGDGNDRERLQGIATALDLNDIVEFRPAFRDREELHRIYSEADVFIMPSRFGKWEGRWRGEGFGIVYVEAAAFEIPSIAYDCGGATEIIEHDKTGLKVKPDDIPALAEAIRTLALDGEKRKAMGRAARKHVLEKFCGAQFRSEIKSSLAPFI